MNNKIPEILKDVIRERIKESYKDLANPKSAIERDMELIHKAYKEGFKDCYIIAHAEKKTLKSKEEIVRTQDSAEGEE